MKALPRTFLLQCVSGMLRDAEFKPRTSAIQFHQSLRYSVFFAATEKLIPPGICIYLFLRWRCVSRA
jgi:hypothetical protein